MSSKNPRGLTPFATFTLLATLALPLAAQTPPTAPNPQVVAVEQEMERISGAVSALRNGLAELAPEKQPAEWASAQNRLGGLLSEAATYLDGSARSSTLREAVLAYQEALRAIDRGAAIQEWSIVSYNLGGAQLALGEALEGQSAAEALRAAIATLEPLPAILPASAGTLRAAALSHLGEALLGLGLALPADDGRLRIERALQVFSEAQQALPAAAQPQQRAMLVYGRARAAAELAARSPAAQAAASREVAIAAYEEAAKIFGGSDQDAELFVGIQQELGILKLQKAMALRGAATVENALAAATAFRQALGVVTREANPDLWGSLQGGLGAALLRAGKSSSPDDPAAVSQLEAGSYAFRNLLGVLPREKDPPAWAQTQHNLGTTLRELGTRLEAERGLQPLRESLLAYRAALEVFTRESDEAAWAEAQFNLVLALRELARRLDPEEAVDLVDEASARMDEARPVLDKLGTANTSALAPIQVPQQ